MTSITDTFTATAYADANSAGGWLQFRLFKNGHLYKIPLAFHNVPNFKVFWNKFLNLLEDSSDDVSGVTGEDFESFKEAFRTAVYRLPAMIDTAYGVWKEKQRAMEKLREIQMLNDYNDFKRKESRNHKILYGHSF